MNNTNKTLNEINEIVKLLEIGNSKEAGEAWEANSTKYSCFLKDSVGVIMKKYINNDSEKIEIAGSLLMLCNDIEFATDMFEDNFAYRWSFIAERAKDKKFVEILKSFGEMDDFDEVTKNTELIISMQNDLVSNRKKKCEIQEEIPE